MTPEENRNLFTTIYKNNIKREGAKELYEWIELSDFFSAPASSNYHLATVGGLCEHSINVYNNLKRLIILEKNVHPELLKNITEENIAICALLHDLCKIDFYVVDEKNVKNEFGVWVKQPYYKIKEKFPMGHGEKSVFLINRFMKLEGQEALAINWHMGAFDKRVIGGDHSVSDAFEKCPLACLTHMADSLASFIDERKVD